MRDHPAEHEDDVQGRGGTSMQNGLERLSLVNVTSPALIDLESNSRGLRVHEEERAEPLPADHEDDVQGRGGRSVQNELEVLILVNVTSPALMELESMRSGERSVKLVPWLPVAVTAVSALERGVETSISRREDSTASEQTRTFV